MFGTIDPDIGISVCGMRTHGKLCHVQGTSVIPEFRTQDGQKVVVLCRAGFYERDGKFQLYVQSMQEAGWISMKLMRSCKKLEKEGLFDPRRKQPLTHCRDALV